jgi:hypothetical protein
VQVHVGCDPFADAYCSPLTGAVTEGSFFDAGAPFNLLIPGFVDLDAVTLEQTGRLFGVHGAYGGQPPGPSGDGVVAFVLFTTIGTGNSPITMETGTVTDVPVPSSLLLLALGLTALARRVRCATITSVLALAALATSGAAHAQTVAVGPYYATPSWDQKIACEAGSNCSRFVVLSNWNQEAVLDRETGLVWQRAPFSFKAQQTSYEATCRDNAVAGGRYGWRLASPDELSSLADPTNTGGQFQLPRGHPFTLDVTEGTEFWTSFRHPAAPDFGLVYDLGAFDPSTGLRPGILPISTRATDSFRGWCVRGPR